MVKEVKAKGKEIKEQTTFRIKKYVLLVESVLLTVASGLVFYVAFTVTTAESVRYLAIVAGSYALIEALLKLDKAIK